MNPIIFEDYTYNNYYPLTLNRPVYDLICGIYSFKERFQFFFKEFSVVVRNEIETITKEEHFSFQSSLEPQEEFLFLSSTYFIQNSKLPQLNEAFVSNDRLLAFKIEGRSIKEIKKSDFFENNLIKEKLLSLGVRFIEISHPKLDYLYDFINYNDKAIIEDSKNFVQNFSCTKKDNVSVIGDGKEIYIHENAKVDPGVYINVENGPVIIDENSIIRSLTTIEGPCYIGKNTLIDGVKIRSGTSIFDVCKIAGEIENSIIFSYTNKHHDGFLGHAYIGSFVNFGAMATNSDLKNNYGNVKLQIEDKIIDTGTIKVGCFIGDHTKLGIGSLINTGSVFGFGCNLFFEGQMYPKFLSSFSWGGKQKSEIYDVNKFIENTKKVLKRRNKALSLEEETLYREIFNRERI